MRQVRDLFPSVASRDRAYSFTQITHNRSYVTLLPILHLGTMWSGTELASAGMEPASYTRQASTLPLWTRQTSPIIMEKNLTFWLAENTAQILRLTLLLEIVD